MINKNIWNEFPILSTPRLHLVRHDIAHAKDMYELRRDPEVNKYLDAHPPQQIAEIETKIREIRADYDEQRGIGWIIIPKETTEAIGYIGLFRIDHKNSRSEFGYALKKKFWRQGLTQEAAKAVIDFGFQEIELHSIFANTNTQNIASQQFLLKLGFKKEAHFREDYYFDGEYLDSFIFGLLEKEWINK